MIQALADLVLVLHLAVVLFVVGGLVLVVAGNRARNRAKWSWVNRVSFRLIHLAAIGTVVAQAWFGITCPLTTLESWLRLQAGGTAYQTGFIEHWLHQLLFYQAPGWVFTLVYSLFGLLVAASWWRYPPRFGQPSRAAVDQAGRRADEHADGA
jgi:polyferredoxin